MTAAAQEQEAQAYLDQFSTNEDTDIITLDRSEIIKRENNIIIKHANDLILERIKGKDWSLKLSEVIAAKDTSFKQNQLIEGKATENININVKELEDKSPDELLALLASLN